MTSQDHRYVQFALARKSGIPLPADEQTRRSYHIGVAIQPNDLRDEVLALPNDARAELAAELLVSLEHDPLQDLDDVRAQWVGEIEDRARRALAGDATSHDWIAVRQRLSDALTE